MTRKPHHLIFLIVIMLIVVVVKAQHLGFAWDGDKFITNYIFMTDDYPSYYYPDNVTPIGYESYGSDDDYKGSGRQTRYLFQDSGVMIYQKKWKYESKWVNYDTIRAGTEEEVANYNKKKSSKSVRGTSFENSLPLITIIIIIIIIIVLVSTRKERERNRKAAASRTYDYYKDKHAKLKKWGKLGRCKNDFQEEINTWHQYSRIKKNWYNIDEYTESKHYSEELANKHKTQVLKAKQEEERKRQEDKDKRESARVSATIVGKLIKKAVDYINSDSSPGVYLIVNNKTLDFYIGESQNMSVRRKTHLGEMTAREHHRPLIQEHFNQYGFDSFDFYILKRTNGMSDEARKEIESIYIDEYNPTYN